MAKNPLANIVYDKLNRQLKKDGIILGRDNVRKLFRIFLMVLREVKLTLSSEELKDRRVIIRGAARVTFNKNSEIRITFPARYRPMPYPTLEGFRLTNIDVERLLKSTSIDDLIG